MITLHVDVAEITARPPVYGHRVTVLKSGGLTGWFGADVCAVQLCDSHNKPIVLTEKGNSAFA